MGVLSDNLMSILPDELYISLKYFYRFHKLPNLKDPQTYNEKLQWLKLNDHNELYHTLADKYEVKKYVEKLIGSEYVIKTLGVYDSFDEIDFDNLPDRFVLKCTHDSGGLVICKDKS
ncbi:MAG: ATP-grasp fold amidoligase family protein, partial [Erysipelotrichaceae bacterium]|nr:ATP-grasp fold amidoligase family protein [Erysipelotrichaceae bacterium]